MLCTNLLFPPPVNSLWVKIQTSLYHNFRDHIRNQPTYHKAHITHKSTEAKKQKSLSRGASLGMHFEDTVFSYIFLLEYNCLIFR